MNNNNYRAALASSPSRYHKAKRGGNKGLRDALEQQRYNNKYLLGKEYISKSNKYNKQNLKIMATKSLLESSLGSAVLSGVRRGMFANFCESLTRSLADSCSCGVGRLTYAALVGAWMRDTANCGYLLNESEGRKIYAANPADPRVHRVGVDGHWSFFVAPAANQEKDLRDSDSLTVLVGSWLRSWSSWFDSVVRFGHYGKGGVPSGSCVSADLLNRCRSLWSFRGVGGRTAATSAEKAQKKVAKAVEGLDAASLLAALRASGVDLSALTAAAAAGAPAGNSESANQD